MKKNSVLYFYESNKNKEKEDYESAYICSFVSKWSPCDIFMINCEHNEEILIKYSYSMCFVKIYNDAQLQMIKDFFARNDIEEDKVLFFGQYCRNNYEKVLHCFNKSIGVITDNEYDAINDYMCRPEEKRGIVYYRDGILLHGDAPESISFVEVPYADRRISKKINQKHIEVCFSKGCLRNCSFCTIGSSKQYSCKSNQMIIAEIKKIASEQNVDDFVFKDLSFEDSRLIYGNDNIKNFAEQIIRENLSIKYDVNFRVNSFSYPKDNELFALLRKSGLIRVLIGIESFVYEDLLLYNKPYGKKEIIDIISLCRNNYIYPVCSFIFVNPHTTVSNLQYNFSCAHELILLDFLPASLNVIRVEKSSILFGKLKKEGTITENGDECSIIWKDKKIYELSRLFEKYYNEYLFWQRFSLIPEIHILLSEIEYLNCYTNISAVARKTINRINDKNYCFILKLLNEDTDINNQGDQLFLEYLSEWDSNVLPIIKKIYTALKKCKDQLY